MATFLLSYTSLPIFFFFLFFHLFFLALPCELGLDEFYVRSKMFMISLLIRLLLTSFLAGPKGLALLHLMRRKPWKMLLMR